MGEGKVKPSLPMAFRVAEHEEASPLLQGTKELKLIPYDEVVMKKCVC